MPTETDEILGYDADHDDPSQYCRHGTWIGSWWGPDYLCGWCEDGISVEEMNRILDAQAERNRQRFMFRGLAEKFTAAMPPSIPDGYRNVVVWTIIEMSRKGA